MVSVGPSPKPLSCSLVHELDSLAYLTLVYRKTGWGWLLQISASLWVERVQCKVMSDPLRISLSVGCAPVVTSVYLARPPSVSLPLSSCFLRRPYRIRQRVCQLLSAHYLHAMVSLLPLSDLDAKLGAFGSAEMILWMYGSTNEVLNSTLTAGLSTTLNRTQI